MASEHTPPKASALIELLAHRRSYYALNSTSTLADSQIQAMLKDILLKVPSAFNTQSCRLVVALGAEHKRVWQATGDILKAKIGDERFDHGTKKKMQGFEDAYGTVLFYEDPTDIEAMKKKFPNYAMHFDGWADHANGMHQLAAWVALEAEGMGGNLQHYNPIIDDKMAELFQVPKEWHLKAQLVFGGIEGGRPDEKEKKPIEQTLRVFGAQN